MEEKNINPAHKLLERLKENKKSINISRVPKKTKDDFIALANKEFCSDYGMLLKWLMDDLINPDTKMIIEKINDFDLRLNELENKSSQEKQTEKSSSIMLDGRDRKGVKK